MMMTKSSWRFLIVLLLSSWRCNLIFPLVRGQEIDQHYVEQTNDGTSYSDQQSNDEKMKSAQKMITDIFGSRRVADQSFAEFASLYEGLLVKLTGYASDQRKAYDDFRNRQAFSVKPSSKITQRQVIENLETTLPTSYKTIAGPPKIEFNNLPTTTGHEKLANLAVNLRLRINKIKKETSNIVIKNRDAHITGNITFNLRVPGNGMRLISKSINVHNMNPFNLLDDLVYRHQTARLKITGPVHLTKRSTASKIFTRATNGLNLAHDVVFKGLDQPHIKSPLRVGYLSINIVSTRSSSQIDDLVFIKSASPVIISSPLVFVSHVYVNNLTAPMVSNVDLQTFRSSALTYNSDQVMPKPIQIRSVRVPSVHLKNKLNGLDYNRRVVQLLRADLPIKVPRLLVISNSFKAYDLNVRNLNNQRFPDDFLLANQPQTIPAPISFSNVRITRGAKIDGLVNGLRYPDSFVTLNGNETINSNLVFVDRVEFNKTVTPTNYIGRHRMSDLVDWAHERSPIMKRVVDNPSGNVIVKGDLHITSTINGLQLNGLLSDLVHLSETKTVKVTGTKTFINSMHVPSLTISEINKSPLKDFASSKTSIVSPLRFVTPLVINNLIWKSTGKSNRILDLINKRISLVHEGTINGDIFIENMVIDSLEIDPLEGRTINNLSPRQLVFSRLNQHIRGPLTFTDVTFIGPVRATKLEIGRTLNTRDINRIMKSSMSPQKLQNFTFDRLVLRNCKVNNLIPNYGDWRVHNRLLVKALRNLLRKDGEQIISNRKRFLYPVSFGSNIKSRSSRGVLYGIQNGPLFLRSNFTIKQKLRLANLVIHGNLKINGKLNGIDMSAPLTDLQNNRNGLYSMISSQSFYAGLTASAIRINYINGRPFDKYWSKRKSPKFMVPVSISNLVVDGEVYLNGLLNHLPIQRVVNQIKSQLSKQSITIYGDVVFKSPVNSKDLSVSGTINNVNFDWLTRSLSNLSTIENINGVKTFKSINIFGNLIVKRLNNQQLSNFLNNIVLIHPNKMLIVGSPVEFTSMTTIREDINCDRLRSNFNSFVNGINLRNLLDQQQQQFRRSTTMDMSTIEFTDTVIIRSPHPIKITGHVNNLDLKRDIVWLRDYFQPYQQITGNKYFKRAHFMSNVYVHSTLNGIDWTDRLKSIIHSRATQNITTNIKFGGKMILNSGLFVSMIGNIPASSLVVTNQSNQSFIRVPARWTFNGPSLIVRKDLTVDGRIKNVSIYELTKFSLKKHVPQTINVPMHFDRLVFKSLDPVSSMFTDLQSTQQLHSNRWNQIASRLNALEKTILSNSPIYTKLTRYIDRAPVVIRGFQMVQSFPGIVGSTIDCHPILTTSKASAYSINVGSLNDDYIIFNNLIFNGSQSTVRVKTITTPYIATHPLTFDQFSYNLYQASPNSTHPSILVNSGQLNVGHLSGRAYDDLQILSITNNGKDKLISGLSSVRGVVETFTLGIVNGKPIITLISTLNVTPNARKISLFMMMNQIYLAVARSSDSDCESENSSSLLLHWREREFKLIQRFNHFEASNVVHYKFNGQSYLVFSESKGKVDRLTDKAIHVYQSIFKKWPYCQFNHFHSIDFEHAIDLQVITIPSPSRSVQLLAALNSSNLTIWQQKGNAGFTRIWSQSLNEGQAFKFFTMNSNTYLIVAQLSRQTGSFIMKAIT